MTTGSQGLAWQIGVWDQISQIYRDEIDPRFEPVVDGLLRRADLQGGECVLDLGTGTGAAAAKAAALVAEEGFVLAIDISPEMLDRARQRSEGGSARFEVREGTAEAVPAGENAFDVMPGVAVADVRHRPCRRCARASSGAPSWRASRGCGLVRT